MKLVHAILYAVAFVLFHLVRLLFEGVRFFVRLGDIVLDALETWLRWHYNCMRKS